MPSRVLITGASGLIGRAVCEELKTSHTLFLTARNRAHLPKDQFHPFDLSQTDQIPSFLDFIKPDVIVHTAAITSIDDVAKNPKLAQLLNVDASHKIAQWCSTNGARMIHFSSDFVFDGQRMDYTENDAPFPISSYGKTKLESELAVQLALKNHLIIRPILVYGYFKQLLRLNFPLLVILKLRNGEQMKITADQVRMPTHVTDISRVVRSCLNDKNTGILHLSGPEAMDMYEFAMRIAKAFQLDQSLLIPVKTANEEPAENRPRVSGFDLTKAKSLFDYRPKSIEEGLKLIPISCQL